MPEQECQSYSAALLVLGQSTVCDTIIEHKKSNSRPEFLQRFRIRKTRQTVTYVSNSWRLFPGTPFGPWRQLAPLQLMELFLLFLSFVFFSAFTNDLALSIFLHLLFGFKCKLFYYISNRNFYTCHICCQINKDTKLYSGILLYERLNFLYFKVYCFSVASFSRLRCSCFTASPVFLRFFIL